MVREPLEGSLRNGVEQVALAATTLAITLIGLALVGELLRRGRRAPNFVATLDRVVPGAARLTAVALIASLPLLAGVRAASADDSVGAWLRGATTTSTTSTAPLTSRRSGPPDTPTTSTTPPVASNATIDRDSPSVVLPPLPAPPSGTPGTPPPTTPVAPTAAFASEQYRVQRGDCLWSIAQRRLPATATNRAIDAGWRAIYLANRAAIGPDPNLIHVGLELALPPLTNLP